MTDSDQTRSSSPLCRHVRELKTLWSAWIRIRSKALRSSDPNTRASANAVEENPYGALLALQRQLRSREFRFEPQKGVLKERKGKNPRPLVISPITNRIVQRAILDTLQSAKPSVKGRLGSIPNILDTPTSVGGIPEKGSSDAVHLIRNSIANGAKHYVRSDIKDFFTQVDTAKLITTIEDVTGDAEFAALLEDGLRVELANADKPGIREWIHLFPGEALGVAQGSSLSAFCANFVLRDLDEALNQNGLIMVRYIDDFVILSHSRTTVMRGWSVAQEMLSEIGLQVHDPSLNDDKASLGRVSQGFDFLSFRFRNNGVGLSRSAKSAILEKVDQVIADAKRSISGSLTQKRRAEIRLAQALTELDCQVRGWGDSFKEVDQRLEFKQLDGKISSRIGGFIGWYTRQTRDRDSHEKMRALGVALLYDTPTPVAPDE
ncbi:MAG: reverse transcriptase domain-containing protein [Alphaproteobacteria bacterium]|nr:reverse transcriptase domain-containing protein [Alphaproteobacteria bacterium]